MDVLGRPIDEAGPIASDEKRAIHQPAPRFDELSPSVELLETGIKVIDLVCPFAKGGKVGLFGGAGVGKDRQHDGTDQQHRQSSTAVCRCSPAWVSVPAKATTSHHEMEESNVLDKVAMVFGQMNEPLATASRGADRPDHGREVPRRRP